MITNNINPILLQIGSLQIRWYGIIYALGFVITYFWLLWLRKKGKLNISEKDLGDLLFWLIIGVVAGARIFEVLFWEPSYYLSNPLRILYLWQGGLSFHGGLAGAVLVVFIWCKMTKKITFLELGDALIIPAFIATGLGRIGNFINGELPGRVTSVSWCVNFSGVEGCRHPQMIYSAIGRFLSAAILGFVGLKERKKGFLFGLGLILFCIERMIVDVWREDMLYFGLTTGQWLSIPLLIIGLWLVFRKEKKDKRTDFKMPKLMLD